MRPHERKPREPKIRGKNRRPRPWGTQYRWRKWDSRKWEEWNTGHGFRTEWERTRYLESANRKSYIFGKQYVQHRKTPDDKT